MDCTKIDNGGGYSIIHEEFAGRECASKCFRYTALGYMVVGYSRRRWGDRLKVLDRWHVVKVGTEYEPKSGSLDKLANA